MAPSSFTFCHPSILSSLHPSCYSIDLLTSGINHSLHPSSSSTQTTLIQIPESPVCFSIKPNSYFSQKLRSNPVLFTKFFPAGRGHHTDLSFLWISIAFYTWYTVTKRFYYRKFLIFQYSYERIMQGEWVPHSLVLTSLLCTSRFSIEQKHLSVSSWDLLYYNVKKSRYKN